MRTIQTLMRIRAAPAAGSSRRYTEAKESPRHEVPGPQGVDHVRGSSGVKVPQTPRYYLSTNRAGRVPSSVDEMLLEHRAEIQQQLEKMDRTIAVVGRLRIVRGGRSALKGKKVPPKYRGPSGETWAGRGARPRWLVAAIKGGKKLDDFLIDKSSARKGRKKRRSKR
jgi:DNA-binding protein H-NS